VAAVIRSAVIVAFALTFGLVPARASGEAPGLPLKGPGFTSYASPAVERWRPMISEASRRFGVPEAWIAAVMHAESGGLTVLDGAPIRSRAGAMGLMQLMPDTWDAMRRLHDLGRDPYDPHDNIMAGAAYLRLMHDRFGYPGLFGAYNAGPARYAEHLLTGSALPDETQAYIAELAHAPAASAMPPPILSGTCLFFTVAVVKPGSREGLPSMKSAASGGAGVSLASPLRNPLFVSLGGPIKKPYK